MTDSMSEDYNKEQDSQLAKAIEECKKVAASSSKEAKENVVFIKDSIETANKEIVSCIKDISKQKIRDEEILTSLKKQLTKIKTTFVSEYDEVEQHVDKKITPSAPQFTYYFILPPTKNLRIKRKALTLHYIHCVIRQAQCIKKGKRSV